MAWTELKWFWTGSGGRRLWGRFGIYPTGSTEGGEFLDQLGDQIFPNRALFLGNSKFGMSWGGYCITRVKNCFQRQHIKGSVLLWAIECICLVWKITKESLIVSGCLLKIFTFRCDGRTLRRTMNTDRPSIIITRWFKYDRDWFACKEAALRSSCATLREWSHNLHPPSCSG